MKFKLFIFLYFICSITCGQTPNWLWAQSVVESNNYSRSVASDASGNVYVSGYFNSPTITFGPYILINSGYIDIFIVKYDIKGKVLWAKSACGSNNDYGISVSVDAFGNAYLTGYFYSSTLSFGSILLTNTGYSDIFLAKYDAYGNVLWAKNAEGTGFDIGSSVHTDASGNAYMTGYFMSPILIFESDTLINSGNSEMFIVKYNANGNVLWAKSAGQSGYSNGCSVTVDTSGSVYVTGSFSDSKIIFGTDTLVNSGNYDMFIVKYDANGNSVWAKSAGGTDSDNGISVSVDISGNTYLTGYFNNSSITFGTVTLFNSGNSDIYLVKYDPSGNVIWAKKAGGTDIDYVTSISLDDAGNIYMTGYFNSSSLTFGSFTLVNSGVSNIFIVKYDNTGNVIWAKSSGGTSSDIGSCLSIDAFGSVYLTGYFSSSAIFFGTINLTNSGLSKLFIAKLQSSNSVIDESNNALNINLSPNPAKDLLNLSFPDNEIVKIINITDISGREYIHQHLIGTNIAINISTLPNGIYIVRAIGKSNVYVGKFIKE